MPYQNGTTLKVCHCDMFIHSPFSTFTHFRHQSHVLYDKESNSSPHSQVSVDWATSYRACVPVGILGLCIFLYLNLLPKKITISFYAKSSCNFLLTTAFQILVSFKNLDSHWDFSVLSFPLGKNVSFRLSIMHLSVDAHFLLTPSRHLWPIWGIWRHAALILPFLAFNEKSLKLICALHSVKAVRVLWVQVECFSEVKYYNLINYMY